MNLEELNRLACSVASKQSLVLFEMYGDIGVIHMTEQQLFEALTLMFKEGYERGNARVIV